METILTMGIMEDVTIIPQPAGGVLYFLTLLMSSMYLLFLMFVFVIKFLLS